MAKSAAERKAAELQRKKAAGYRQINFCLSGEAVGHLRALASAYGMTQPQTLEQALFDAYSKLSEMKIIEGLYVTDDMQNKEVAIYLLDVCCCPVDQEKIPFISPSFNNPVAFVRNVDRL